MLKRCSGKVLAEGKRIIAIARDAGDLRLGLQALDRVQRSLDQLLKVHEMSDYLSIFHRWNAWSNECGERQIEADPQGYYRA